MMMGKTIVFISFLFALTSLATPSLKANPLLRPIDSNAVALTNVTGLIADTVNFDKITIKRSQPYDETKDPALRKSVDKANVLPWGAIIMPIAVFLAFVFVFLRKKDLD